MSLGLLDDIFRVGSLVPHVAEHTDQPDYLSDVEEMEELSDQRDDLLQRVSNAITQVYVLAGAARFGAALATFLVFDRFFFFFNFYTLWRPLSLTSLYLQVFIRGKTSFVLFFNPFLTQHGCVFICMYLFSSSGGVRKLNFVG